MLQHFFKTAIVAAFVVSAAICNPALADNAMKIVIKTDDEVVPVTLDNNATARDFMALLPLRLTLTDYASTEKISDLPRKLSTQDAPAAIDPVTGDVTYYAPWGNLAIFHKDFRNSPGLIRLGKIETGMARLARSGPIEVTIEAAP